jgi:geranylgeranyl pyrophosphate synthase
METRSAIAINDVQKLIRDRLSQTVLKPIIDAIADSVCGGKMVRAQLGLRVGTAAGTDSRALLCGMAAVEMTHGASLLHDDVIDGGILRRGAPSFWVEKGTSGAVILGDLLVCKAFEVLMEAGDTNLLGELITLTGDMCEGEANQELLLRNETPNWASSVDIARRKTGALFAFAGFVAGGKDEHLSAALKESGYDIGTAYQLADDILDAFGDADAAGKTLGTDEAGAKITAAAAWQQDGIDPKAYIDDLCVSASARLERWPDVRQAWDSYITDEFSPVINSFTESFCTAEHE